MNWITIAKRKPIWILNLKGNYGRRVTYFILPPEDSRTSWYKRFIKKKKYRYIYTLFTPVASTVWDLWAVAVWQANLSFNAVAYWQVNYYAEASDKTFYLEDFSNDMPEHLT